MQGMEQEAQLLSPLLQKAEVLLVLLVVLAASITWLFWELFSFVNRESDDNGDWWEELKNCNHKRLIIPVRRRGWAQEGGPMVTRWCHVNGVWWWHSRSVWSRSSSLARCPGSRW